jgi:hypothetical protein
MRVVAGVLLLALVAAPAFARDSLGVFERWAAFRDPASRSAALRCYAIAEPEGGNGAYATIAFWPQARVRGQYYVRLPRAAAAGTTASLTLGSRRFALIARGTGLWAADARADAAIVAAMRSACAGGCAARRPRSTRRRWAACSGRGPTLTNLFASL